MDDTNRAFDWDHICPQSYIYNKRGINRTLKDWYNSNGNFRAWSYSLNRSDQDVAPEGKLNPTSDDEIDWWAKYLKNGNLKEHTLKEYLLDASFCDEEWLDLNNDDLMNINKDNNLAKQVINCILQRNYQICEEWYNELKIDELSSERLKKKDIKELFENIINNKMWEKEQEEDGQHGHTLSIGDNNLGLYFSYNTEGDTLKEDEIYFGIRSEDKALENIKISKELEDKYVQEEESIYTYIGFSFTLISYSENSMIDLFKSFNEWLKKFPDNKIRKMATKRFHNSIKVQYKKEILNKN